MIPNAAMKGTSGAKSTTTLQTGGMHNEGQDESNRPKILGQNQANTSKGAHLPSNKGGKI